MPSCVREDPRTADGLGTRARAREIGWRTQKPGHIHDDEVVDGWSLYAVCIHARAIVVRPYKLGLVHAWADPVSSMRVHVCKRTGCAWTAGRLRQHPGCPKYCVRTDRRQTPVTIDRGMAPSAFLFRIRADVRAALTAHDERHGQPRRPPWPQWAGLRQEP